jgi:hypothetical protein
VSLAGNVLEVPAGDVRWNWLIPIGEMNTNPNGAKPSLILFCLFTIYSWINKGNLQ